MLTIWAYGFTLMCTRSISDTLLNFGLVHYNVGVPRHARKTEVIIFQVTDVQFKKSWYQNVRWIEENNFNKQSNTLKSFKDLFCTKNTWIWPNFSPFWPPKDTRNAAPKRPRVFINVPKCRFFMLNKLVQWNKNDSKLFKGTFNSIYGIWMSPKLYP